MRVNGAAKLLALLFFLGLTWPVLRLADEAFALFGVPALFAYIFGGWAFLVLALAAVSRKLKD